VRLQGYTPQVQLAAKGTIRRGIDQRIDALPESNFQPLPIADFRNDPDRDV
jgi:hypothetical protein